MPLDSVVDRLNNRKRQAPSARAFVESSQPSRMAGNSPYVNRMIELIDRPGLQAQDIRDGFVTIASGLVDLESQIAELSTAVARKPEGFDPVIEEVAKLKAGLQNLVTAIRGIKLPEVQIPEFPEIPKPEPVDLEPIKSELAEIRRIVSTPEVEEGEVAKTRSWTFDVKRGPGGYIKTIEAREE